MNLAQRAWWWFCFVETWISDCVTLSRQGSCVTILAPPAGKIYLHLANVTVKPECRTNITNRVCLRSFWSCPNTSNTSRTRGGGNSKGERQFIIWPNIIPRQKKKKILHENERNWTERECASLAPLLDPPMKMATVGLVSGSFIVAVGYRVQRDTATRGLRSMSGRGLPPQN